MRTRLRVVAVLACAVVVTALSAGSAGAASGSLDPHFGVNGHAIARVGDVQPRYWYEQEVLGARSPSGDLFAASVAGPAGSSTIVDFTPRGQIRRSFGEGGRLRVGPVGGSTFVLTAIASDQQGDVLVAGRVLSEKSPVTVFRFLPDGSLDHSFGADGAGYAQTGIPNGLSGEKSHESDWVTAIAIDPMGRIVIAGTANTGDGFCGELNSSFVTRLDSDGSVDTGFGNGGATVFPLTRMASGFGMALTSEGAPLVFGQNAHCKPPPAGNLMARLTPTGGPDTGFGTGGAIGTGGLLAIAIDSSEGVLTLGYEGRLSRYTSAGNLDAGFARGGTRAMPKGWTPGGLAVAENGDTFVTGTLKDPKQRQQLLLTEVGADGRVVHSFGRNGLVRTALGPGTGASGRQVLVDGRGRALVAAATSSKAAPAGVGWFRFEARP